MLHTDCGKLILIERIEIPTHFGAIDPSLTELLDVWDKADLHRLADPPIRCVSVDLNP